MAKREAISFGRFSSKPQEKGHSLERQRAAYQRVCQRYADRCEPSARFGFGHFFGAGESGFHGRHLRKGGSLRALLDLMAGGEVDPARCCLVVEAFDRLGRLEPDLAVGLLSEIVRSGCPVAVDAPDLWLETRDLGGHKFILVAALVQLAHAESLQKSERGRASWAARRGRARLQGGVQTSRFPWWIERRGDRFVLRPERAAAVRRIYDEYVGGAGAQVIARRLNDEGVKPPGRAAAWGQYAVRELLVSRAVVGEYQPRVLLAQGGALRRADAGPPVAGYYPAVIDEQTWALAGAARAQRGGMAGRGGHVGENLFRGALYDAASRAAMQIKIKWSHGVRYRYLVPARAGLDGAGWFSAPYDAVEAGFWAFVDGLDLGPARPQDVRAQVREQQAVLAELAARAARLDALADLDELEAAARRIRALRLEAQARLDALLARQACGEARAADQLKEVGRLRRERREGGALGEFYHLARNRMRAVVSEMWLTFRRTNKRRRAAGVQVHLRAGGWRWFTIEMAGEVKVWPGRPDWVDPSADLRAGA